ncbi:hypothetical protein BJV78DRAFT_237461 [Lactifluus subvellereus]|nr:hypothetical protein BJV78DRAFT_237461 [Lactifluus subvellereus]
MIIGVRISGHLGGLRRGQSFLVFRRDGPNANSGALFLTVSEDNVCDGYTISRNCYNLGRDGFEEGTPGLKYRGVKYKTTVQSISGMILPISMGYGINI